MLLHSNIRSITIDELYDSSCDIYAEVPKQISDYLNNIKLVDHFKITANTRLRELFVLWDVGDVLAAVKEHLGFTFGYVQSLEIVEV